VKLLLDQNLSPRLESLLKKTGVDCSQVRSLHLENASDISIWQYAKSNGYATITSDSDFSDFAIVKGIPPRIIFCATGTQVPKDI